MEILPINRKQRRKILIDLKKVINFAKENKNELHADANRGDAQAQTILDFLAQQETLQSNEDRVVAYYQFKKILKEMPGRLNVEEVMELQREE